MEGAGADFLEGDHDRCRIFEGTIRPGKVTGSAVPGQVEEEEPVASGKVFDLAGKQARVLAVAMNKN
jgi:hypothetical protein